MGEALVGASPPRAPNKGRAANQGCGALVRDCILDSEGDPKSIDGNKVGPVELQGSIVVHLSRICCTSAELNSCMRCIL